MKKIIEKLFLLFIILLVMYGTYSWTSLYQHYHPMSYQASNSPEINTYLDNPFRGFYHMYGFTLSEEDPEDMTKRTKQYINSGSLQLMLVQINLKNYSETDLSDNALEQLDRILAEIHDAKRQVIMRFLYDWDGRARETEPDNIEQITRHMDQIGPVISRYADEVFLLQSTFTGNSGEMTQTNFGSHEDNRLLMSHLAQVTDPSIYLAVRTPSHLRGITQSRTPVSLETAYNGSLGSRLGLYNDGMLGSSFDLGTYDNTPNTDTTAPEDKGTREEEINFQNYICQFVPNGGEAVLYDDPYSDLENAIPDLAKMHVTYLNCDHDADVMDKWKESVYHGGDCFDGTSGYDYVAAHLGYRYVMTDSFFSYDALDDTSGTLSLTIQNTGFAPAYRLFNGAITIENVSTGLKLILPVSIDNRKIGGGSQADFTFPLVLHGLTEGSYSVFFSLSDPYTGQIIQFANEDTDASGNVHIGTLNVEPVSPEGLLSYLKGYLQNR